MTRRSWLAAGLAAAVATAPMAQAEDKAPGAGARTCEAWNAAEGGNVVVLIEMIAWVQGFVSGAAPSRHIDLHEGLDGQALKEWIDKRCRDHGSDTLQTVAQSLVDALAKAGPTAQ